MNCSHMSCQQDPGDINEKTWLEKDVGNLNTDELEHKENDGKFFIMEFILQPSF